jgi:hypothetical protein
MSALDELQRIDALERATLSAAVMGHLVRGESQLRGVTGFFGRSERWPMGL